MSIVHSIACYDRQMELLAFASRVPDPEIALAKGLTHVPLEDQNAMSSYPLSESDARSLALRLDLFVPVDHDVWFLEPLDPQA